MKKIIAILLLCPGMAPAQNGTLPPVYFNGSTDICDNTPWKLVLYDEFNGNSLAAPWLTYHTYLWDARWRK